MFTKNDKFKIFSCPCIALISLYVISNMVFGIEFMGNGIGRVHGEDSFPQVEEI